MFCNNCGKRLQEGKSFCSECGHPAGAVPNADAGNGGNANYVKKVQSNANNPTQDVNAVYAAKPAVADSAPAKKKNTVLIAAISAIAVVAVAAIIVVAVVFMNNNKEENASDRDTEVGTTRKNPSPQSPKDPSEPEPPVEPSDPQPEKKFDRTVTYNKDFTYENLPSIHSSKQSDDKTSFELAELMTNYNDAWVDFVNYGDEKLLDFIREGSYVYKEKERFGDVDYTEKLTFMDVEDVREYNGNYYVWTHEILEKKYPDEVLEYEYHWVYLVTKAGDKYYVEAYDHDPFYE